MGWAVENSRVLHWDPGSWEWGVVQAPGSDPGRHPDPDLTYFTVL